MRPGSLALVIAALAAMLVFALALRDAVQTARAPWAYAAPRGVDPAGRTYQNGNTNDNAFEAENVEGDNEDGDNDDSDNEDFDNDNFDIDIGPYLPPPSAPIRPPEPVCSTPGRDTALTSVDRKVTVRIPGSSPDPLRADIYLVINAHEAPPPPGAFVYPLVYEVRVSSCGASPLVTLPAETVLAIHYDDVEVIGLDENRLVLGSLNMTTATWEPLDQPANDPTANVVAATITDSGYFMVWEAR